jgi:hypothetical protein
MLQAVSGHSTKLISFLLLMAFVFSMGCCVVACADDDHSPTTDACQHCVMNCACHPLAVMPSSTHPVWSPSLCYLALGDAPLKLPLFAASIFQPPKA